MVERFNMFCVTCGGPMWHLKGTDVDTCRRGHHHLCEPARCPDLTDPTPVPKAQNAQTGGTDETPRTPG